MKELETLTIVGGESPYSHALKVFLSGEEVVNLKGIRFSAFAGELTQVELHVMTKVDKIEIINLQSADLNLIDVDKNADTV